MKRTLVQKLGLLGLVSFFSYAAAVIFAPLPVTLGVFRYTLSGI